MASDSEMDSTVLLGLGSYAPERRLTNVELSELVETSEEWIMTRTGIRERRIASDGESTSDLAVLAAERALTDAGVTPGEIDLVVVATITPDMAFPSTACLLQAKLGLGNVCCFDLEAACSGFVYALDVADALLRSGRYGKALVIGAEKLSSIMDWTDRTTCVLFGDGAGAAVLGCEGEGPRLLGFLCEANGTNPNLLLQPAGGSAMPATESTVRERGHCLKMNGKEIFKHAVRVMEEAALRLLERHGLTPEDIDHVIPHQANARIVESLAQRTGIPMEKFYCNLEKYGNTSAASIPLAMDEARRAGIHSSGELGLLVAFGAGLTWAAALMRF